MSRSACRSLHLVPQVCLESCYVHIVDFLLVKQMTESRCSRCSEFKVGVKNIIQAGHGARYQVNSFLNCSLVLIFCHYSSLLNRDWYTGGSNTSWRLMFAD